MRKDFAKKDFTKQVTHTTEKKWPWTLCIVVMVLFICLAGFFSYNKSPTSSLLSSYVAHVKTWIAERKARLHHEVVKAKQVVVNKNDSEPEIHFEFYTALPNMQITVSGPFTNEKSRDSNTNLAIKMASKQMAIFDEEQIEREFSAEYKRRSGKKK